MRNEWTELMNYKDEDKVIYISFHPEVTQEQLIKLESNNDKLYQIVKLKYKMSTNEIQDYFRKNPDKMTYRLYIKNRFIHRFPIYSAFNKAKSLGTL